MKKFKLLASIASMCLAIAVLCFGVFAASSVTYTISGTITYDVSDVFVNVTTAVYSYEGQLSSTDLNTLAGKFGAAATTGNQTVDSKTMTFKSYGTYKNSGSAVDGFIDLDGTNIKTDKTKLNLAYSNGTTKELSFFIVTTVENLANKALKVTCGTMAALTNNNLGSKTITTVAANSSGTFVYAMSIADLKVAIPSTEFSAVVTFAY